jgi:hypothetical protein
MALGILLCDKSEVQTQRVIRGGVKEAKAFPIIAYHCPIGISQCLCPNSCPNFGFIECSGPLTVL